MRLDRRLAVLLVLALPSIANAEGIVRVQHGVPETEVAALVAAENEFCKMAAATSIRDAFFDYMANDAILFRPGPVNGKEFFRTRPSNPGPALTWHPTYAELASTGDLGWTTGPWEYRSAKDKPAKAWGHFASVWKKQTNGKWKVMFDEGHSCKAPADDSLTWGRLSSKTPEGDVALIKQFTTAHTRLLEADGAYSQALVADGIGGALAKFGDEDVRVLREDQPLLVGAEASGKALEHEWDGGAKAWDTSAGTISNGTDLAVTYGTVTLAAKGKVKAEDRKVFRIWRRAPDGGWKLALDVTNPMPAPAPPPKNAAATKKS
jgi:ketosteroid isomerase-like protein